jgi:hypothetical protein
VEQQAPASPGERVPKRGAPRPGDDRLGSRQRAAERPFGRCAGKKRRELRAVEVEQGRDGTRSDEDARRASGRQEIHVVARAAERSNRGPQQEEIAERSRPDE